MKMDTSIIIAIVAGGLALLFALWWIITSNDFKRKEIRVSEALSGIEVALIKRFDLLTKLLDVTKSFAKHEKELFTQITQMRKGMTVTEVAQASAQYDQLAARIHAVAEGYPELRSAAVFRELQAGARGVEQHLQAARRLYSSNVTLYNTAIAVFPTSVVAKSQNLKAAEFIVAEEVKRTDVSLSM